MQAPILGEKLGPSTGAPSDRFAAPILVGIIAVVLPRARYSTRAIVRSGGRFTEITSAENLSGDSSSDRPQIAKRGCLSKSLTARVQRVIRASRAGGVSGAT